MSLYLRSVIPKLRVAHGKCGRIPGKCWPFLVMGQSFVKKKGIMIFLAQLNKHKCSLPSEKEIYIYLSRQLLPASLLK